MPSQVELTLNDVRTRVRQIEKEVTTHMRKLERAPEGSMHPQQDYGVRGVSLNILFDFLNVREFDQIAEVVTRLMTEHRSLRRTERKLEDEVAVERKAVSMVGTGVREAVRGVFNDL